MEANEPQSEIVEALNRPFTVVSLSRLDLTLAGLAQDVALSLTDEEMEAIAVGMTSAFKNTTFWNVLRIETNKKLEEKEPHPNPFAPLEN